MGFHCISNSLTAEARIPVPSISGGDGISWIGSVAGSGDGIGKASEAKWVMYSTKNTVKPVSQDPGNCGHLHCTYSGCLFKVPNFTPLKVVDLAPANHGHLHILCSGQISGCM